MLTENYFEKVITLPSPASLVSTIQTENPDVLLLDMNFHAGINTGNEGIFWLNEVNSKFPKLKVVLFTAYADVDLAVRAMKDGAFDFIVKPWNNEKLIETLLNAYNEGKSKLGCRIPSDERRYRAHWNSATPADGPTRRWCH